MNNMTLLIRSQLFLFFLIGHISTSSAQDWVGCIETNIDFRTDFPIVSVQNNCDFNIVAIMCMKEKKSGQIVEYFQSIVGKGGSASESVYFHDRYDYAEAFACKVNAAECGEGYLVCPEKR